MATPVDANLTGRVCIVTGANTGMGRVMAQELARMGATVVLACRSAERGEAARAAIAQATGSKTVSVMPLDLASQASIRAFAAAFLREHKALHVLVNNAAAWWTDRRTSPDGVELQWATNVLGPYLLTSLLLDALKAGKGRVVNVASTAASGLDLDDPEYARRKYSGVTAYSATKQANRMMTWALADQLKGTGVTANAMNPGLVNTELNRNTTGIFTVLFKITKLFSKTPEAGADTAVWLAASPEVEGVSGKFWDNRKEVPCKFRDPAAVEKLRLLCEARLAGGAASATA